jgi:hypothetical protein
MLSNDLKTIRFSVMAGQKREARLRARCPGHPRLSSRQKKKDVDARDKPGHDGGFPAQTKRCDRDPIQSNRNMIRGFKIVRPDELRQTPS